MKYATETGTGNHGMDADLDTIEEDLLPGANRAPSNQLLASIRRLADISNQDENSTKPTAIGQHAPETIDLAGQPPLVRSETAAVTPGSLSTLVGPASKGNQMSLNKRIAYVMENGQPFCNHCESYYLPKSLGKIACTDCGCNRPNDDHGRVEPDFSHAEGETVLDEVGGKEIIKQESRTFNLDSTDGYLELFNSKIATDSDNYYRGYVDAENGQELDEDLALLSDDYYNGYEQHKFYNKTPQQSVGQSLYDMKPNSNSLPRNYDNKLSPGEFDRGPIQLTDGQGFAAVAGKLPFPADVIENFFEI